jgi:23S rRNA (guanosine2251-2'-O)-methyltransferase
LKTSPPDRGGASRRRPAIRTDRSGTRADSETFKDDDVLAGRRAVIEALRAGRPLRKVMISRSAHGPTVREIIHEARGLGIVVQFVDPRHLHAGLEAQGVVALASARPTVRVENILAGAAARGEPPFVLVLDGVEDPANLGALIRTADGAGVHGVIIPRHRAVGLTPAVARASAGAIEHVPVAVVGNLVRTLEELKRAGLWIVGADMQAPQPYLEASLMPPLAVVVGGEGRGLGRLVRERCDLVVSLPMRGRTASLNVSVAAGIILYEVVRRIAGTGAAGGAPASRSHGVGTQ